MTSRPKGRPWELRAHAGPGPRWGLRCAAQEASSASEAPAERAALGGDCAHVGRPFGATTRPETEANAALASGPREPPAQRCSQDPPSREGQL